MSENGFSKYLDEIASLQPLSREHEATLGRTVQIGLRKCATSVQRKASEVAQRELILSHLKLVVSIARHYYGCGLAIEDLTSEGNKGLMITAKRYRPRQFKTRLSTFATFYIRLAVQEAILHSPAIWVPVKPARQLRRIRRSHSFNEEKPLQDIEQIHRDTGVPIRQIEVLLRVPYIPVRLCDSQGEDSDDGAEFDLDSGYDNPAEITMREDEFRFVRGAISRLNPIQREIICARFGISTGVSQSRVRVAAGRGVSVESIRTIEKQALEDLRMKLNNLFS